MTIRTDPDIVYLLAMERELLDVLAREPQQAERLRLVERMVAAQEKLIDHVENKVENRTRR